MLFPQCTIFPHVNVPPPRYGQIYSIISDDKCYNIIGNFPRCSCVYFVAMLATSLGSLGVYV
jgi:hypothetical protein